MTFTRQLGFLTAITAVLLLPHAACAQAPDTTPPVYTGNVGGGFAVTRGNTDTNNFNVTSALVRDPKTRNVIKTNVTYFRGSQSDIVSVDRASFNLRDEYTISGRTFFFGQLDYLRDQFKQMIFFWAPTAGIGYKLISTDATQFILDGGGGGLLEKNPGIATSKAGSVTAGQQFSQKLSQTATVTESLASIWKASDFNDSLTNFSVGVTTTVVGNIQLKLELLDGYKNKPAGVSIKKNDTALVTSFILKFQ